MDKTLDFIARVGEIGLGLVFLALGAAIIVVVVIEVVDYLFVDPIVRQQSKPTVDELVKPDCDCAAHQYRGRECTCNCDHTKEN